MLGALLMLPGSNDDGPDADADAEGAGYADEVGVDEIA